MGYVGCVSAACLANEGHVVTGIDLDPNKVDLINSSRSPVIEEGLEDMIAAAVKSRHLTVATDTSTLGELSFVCVGTPSNENGSLDLRQVLRVCQQLGKVLKSMDSYHVVNIRSTVVPGTVESSIIPLLERASNKKAGRDFDVCMNPEFLRESTAVKDFYRPPFTIIGAREGQGAELVRDLYAGVEAPLEIVPIKVAEMIKYACNSFHALKVAFANEVGNICKAMGIDSWQVMDIFCQDTKLNLSPYYLKPGFAFGGSCLPKDLRAIIHLAKQRDIDLPVLGAVLDSNQLQLDRAYSLIKRTGKTRVGVLGLSFKAGTDDLRESPTVALIERLIGKGYHVSIYDDDVALPEIRGKNKQFIERTLPHISSLMKTSIDEVIETSEVLTLCKRHKKYETVASKADGKRAIIDLVRVLHNGNTSSRFYEGICW
jgi:GDP-mannose 6-dehydrogenase